MDINDAMRIRRCIKALADGGKTLDELATAVGLEEGETKATFEVFVLTLVVANLVGAKGQRYVLSEVFMEVAARQIAGVYGGKRVLIRQMSCNPGEVLSALVGGGK